MRKEKISRLEIDDFCSLSVKDQEKHLSEWEKVKWFERPFYIVQLIDAIKHKKPISLIFSDQLIQVYWDILHLKEGNNE